MAVPIQSTKLVPITMSPEPIVAPNCNAKIDYLTKYLSVGGIHIFIIKLEAVNDILTGLLILVTFCTLSGIPPLLLSLLEV